MIAVQDAKGLNGYIRLSAVTTICPHPHSWEDEGWLIHLGTKSISTTKKEAKRIVNLINKKAAE